MIEVVIGNESIEQLQDLRRRHQAAIKALETTGDTPTVRMLAFISSRIGDVWENTAPILTGTLRSATREEVEGGQARVFINPSVVNPILGGKPSVYGPKVHADRNPWVERLYHGAAPRIVQQGIEKFTSEFDDIYNQ